MGSHKAFSLKPPADFPVESIYWMVPLHAHQWGWVGGGSQAWEVEAVFPFSHSASAPVLAPEQSQPPRHNWELSARWSGEGVTREKEAPS